MKRFIAAFLFTLASFSLTAGPGQQMLFATLGTGGGSGSVEVGTTTIGGSSTTFSSAYRFWFIKWTATHTGTLDQISVYSSNATTLDVKFGLYETENVQHLPSLKITGTPLELTGVGTWATGWKDFDVSAAAFAVVSGHEYIMALQTSADTITVYYDAVPNRCFKAFAYSDAWGNDPVDALDRDDVKYSVKGRITYP